MGKFFEALAKAGRTELSEISPMAAGEVAAENRSEEALQSDAVRLLKTDSEKREATVVAIPSSVKEELRPEPVVVKHDSVPEAERIAAELVAFHGPRSFDAEQFKLLRTRLLFPKPGEQPPRTLMVTSALPGEGKSFVSANLAISIAQGVQEHVLLMDCDLRRPTIHRLFGYSGDRPGLSRYLSDDTVSLQDVLLKTAIDKLTLLPAGVSVANPAELLSSPRMMALIEEVRARYNDRYVIIDTPPPKMISEANALARQVDGILLVIRYGKTPRKVLKDLVESLAPEKIIGSVMNRFDVQMGSLYGSYYNYRSHNKYYR